jgi:hypothetical protein
LQNEAVDERSEGAKRVKEAGRRYLPWSRSEDDDLIRSYREGMTPAQLAARHERTAGAIESRLLHLGETQARQRA